MAKNSNLHSAKNAKNDEFYTQLTDIEKELKHYKHHFEDKVIFCNCDDPEWSNFWKYFSLNFDHLKLKKLISTHYETNKQSYMLVMYRDEAGVHTEIKTLQQNGDFRSPENIDLLKQADIVVTNPPFSLFREYIAQLMEYEKKFIIIGNKNAITYKEFFSLMKDNKVWIGYNNVPQFSQPDGTFKKFGNIGWYTNLDITKRHENIILYKKYYGDDGNPLLNIDNVYPKYDNYDAINVDKVSEIPCDYFGMIGVPISFLDKYCPEQFEIVDLGIVGTCTFTCNKKMEILDKDGIPTGKYTYNAKGTLYRKHLDSDKKPAAFKDCETGELYQSIYARIIIKKREEREVYENRIKRNYH